MRLLTAFVCCLGCLVAASLNAREPAQQKPPAAASSRTAAQLAKALDEGGTVVLQDVLFETDKTTITPKSTHELDEIGAVLVRNAALRLEIRGRTTPIGGTPGTLALSQARAQAVRDYLINKFHIQPNRLVATGVADAGPISDTTTERGRLQSGPIELVKLPQATERAPNRAGSASAAGSGEWTGRITTGMMAIGGETTGLTLSNDREAFELQPANDAIRRQLQDAAGKTATVRGKLDVRQGVEVRERRIITVTEVTAR